MVVANVLLLKLMNSKGLPCCWYLDWK